MSSGIGGWNGFQLRKSTELDRIRSTARSTRSSSQSIRNSANVRVLGLRQSESGTPLNESDQGLGALIQRNDHEVLLPDHKTVRLNADLGVAQAEGRTCHEPESSIEPRVSEQDDCRFAATLCLLQTTSDELGTDASALVVWENPHGAEDDERAVSDPRPAELHVANDYFIKLGNEDERPRLVADSSDRFNNVVSLVAISRPRAQTPDLRAARVER